MKRYKKQSHLVKAAIHKVTSRQAEINRNFTKLLKNGGDFLQNCAARLRLPR